MKMFDEEEEVPLAKIDVKTNNLNNKLNLLLNDGNETSFNPIQRSNTITLPKFEPKSKLNEIKEVKEDKNNQDNKPKKTAFFEDDEIIPIKKPIETNKPNETLKTKDILTEQLKDKKKEEIEQTKRKPIFFDEEEDMSQPNKSLIIKNILMDVPQIEQINEISNVENASIIHPTEPIMNNISQTQDIKKISQEIEQDITRQNRSQSLNNSKFSGIQNVSYS
jgi:hypothetical protein